MPTPYPAKKRPATKSGMAVAAVWRMTPKVKTSVETIRPHRRPKKSPVGAAVKAPQKVPADSKDTIKDDCDAVMAGSPVLSSMAPVEKVLSQYGMARMPPLCSRQSRGRYSRTLIDWTITHNGACVISGFRTDQHVVDEGSSVCSWEEKESVSYPNKTPPACHVSPELPTNNMLNGRGRGEEILTKCNKEADDNGRPSLAWSARWRLDGESHDGKPRRVPMNAKEKRRWYELQVGMYSTTPDDSRKPRDSRLLWGSWGSPSTTDCQTATRAARIPMKLVNCSHTHPSIHQACVKHLSSIVSGGGKMSTSHCTSLPALPLSSPPQSTSFSRPDYPGPGIMARGVFFFTRHYPDCHAVQCRHSPECES